MNQIGIVEEVQDSRVRVRVKRISACGGNCAGCKMHCGGELLVTAENKANARVGDSVELQMPSKTVLGAAVFVYILPVLAFIFGYMIADSIFYNESISTVTGIVMMAAVYVINIVRSRKNIEKYNLVVEKII